MRNNNVSTISQSMANISLLVLGCLLLGTTGKTGFGPGEQEWDFVQVRKGAYLFWWMYYTTADVSSFTEKPLIIWLQGGPGASSTGFGNFAELGPLDTALNPRNFTWVKNANVIFVDNPVGTGFSYVDDFNKLARDNRQIADDLVEMMRAFYKKLPEFQTVPLFITSESYGGKMAAEFALRLDEASKTGSIECNLQGVLLGDAWISPIDTVLTWGPYLFHTGLIDVQGLSSINKAADKTKQLLDSGRFKLATEQWGATEGLIMQHTYYADFYNILTKKHSYNRRSLIHSPHLVMPGTSDEDDKLPRIMTGVADALGITRAWSSHNSVVFNALKADFMKPVTHIVEELLNNTNVKCVVINGQLDLIVDTPGTVAWVDKLQWTGSQAYAKSSRNPIVYEGVIEGYEKTYDNFEMYWISRAGHMVPSDNPAAMDYVLRKMTDDYNA